MRNPEKVVALLETYVQTAAEVHAQVARVQRESSSFYETVGYHEAFLQLPDAVRGRILNLEPRVERILQAVDGALFREFRYTVSLQERADVVRRAVSTIHSMEEVDDWLGPVAPAPDPRALSPVVAGPAAVYWDAGQYRVAIDQAAKAVNVHLQTALGRQNLDNTDLARQAFSLNPPSPTEPRLRFPGLDRAVDERTWKSRHRGAMEFAAGLFQAVRNVTAHADPGDDEPPPEYALDCLAAFSLLARWIDEAERREDGD